MSYRIAAIDVHKKMLAVVVTDVAGEGESIRVGKNHRFDVREVMEALQALGRYLPVIAERVPCAQIVCAFRRSGTPGPAGPMKAPFEPPGNHTDTW